MMRIKHYQVVVIVDDDDDVHYEIKKTKEKGRGTRTLSRVSAFEHCKPD